jgi:type I restriction enzyme S subunit
MSWPTVKLEDVFEIVRGGSPRPIDQYITEESDGLNWISIKDASNSGKYITKTKLKIKKEGLSKSRLVKPGDFLLTNSMSFGRPYIMKTSGCIHDGWLALTGDPEKVDADFFYYLLGSNLLKSKFAALAKGAVVKNLNINLVKGVQIPLPPLETQKQIAAVLEKADQLRKDCQQMEQELNSLAQSVFIDMFGDPVTNPKGWDKAPLSAIVDEFLGGKSLVAADDQNTEYKNRVLKISAVTSGEFKPRESKPLPNDYEPQVEHFVKAGDLLFSRANTTELVGATTMVFDEHTGLVLPDKLWRFVWKDEKSLSPVFIWQQLCEAGVRKEISKLSSGSGGSMKNISKGKLNTLQIIFPPLELQQKFERIYLKLRVELSNNQQQIKFADQAFNALMQKAFKGELNL